MKTETAKEIKERPILFSAPMVKAILAGAKTQTRRIVKPIYKDGSDLQNVAKWNQPFSKIGFETGGQFWDTLKEYKLDSGGTQFRESARRACPYGKVGDRLWVRETWRPIEREDLTDGVLFRADDGFQVIENTAEAANKWVEVYDNGKFNNKWKPSIFMPRWASRIILEITHIRVERLQEIDEMDALFEGVQSNHIQHEIWEHKVGDITGKSAKDVFQKLWSKINGEKSWSENPFVWVIEFKKI